MQTPRGQSIDAPYLQLLPEGEPALVVVIVFTFFLGLMGVYFGYRSYQTGQLLADVEETPIGSATPGRAAITGVARPAGETLERLFTEEPCLHYSYKIRETAEKEGQVDEERDEFSGPRETETRTVARGSDEVPFYLEDETGRVLVQADDGADFTVGGEHSESFTENEQRKEYRKLGPVKISEATTWDDRVVQRNISHRALPPGEEVFVFGSIAGRSEAGETETDADAVVTEDEETGKFIVSTKGKDALAKGVLEERPDRHADGRAAERRDARDPRLRLRDRLRRINVVSYR